MAKNKKRSERGYTFDVVIGPPEQAGFTETGEAVVISFSGMVRDVRGTYTAAVLTPAVPTVVGALLAHVGEAQALLAASGSAVPNPIPLPAQSAQVAEANESHVRIVLQLSPESTLPVDLPREAAQALFASLAQRLSS